MSNLYRTVHHDHLSFVRYNIQDSSMFPASQRCSDQPQYIPDPNITASQYPSSVHTVWTLSNPAGDDLSRTPDQLFDSTQGYVYSRPANAVEVGITSIGSYSNKHATVPRAFDPTDLSNASIDGYNLSPQYKYNTTTDESIPSDSGGRYHGQQEQNYTTATSYLDQAYKAGHPHRIQPVRQPQDSWSRSYYNTNDASAKSTVYSTRYPYSNLNDRRTNRVMTPLNMNFTYAQRPPYSSPPQVSQFGTVRQNSTSSSQVMSLDSATSQGFPFSNSARSGYRSNSCSSPVLANHFNSPQTPPTANSLTSLHAPDGDRTCICGAVFRGETKTAKSNLKRHISERCDERPWFYCNIDGCQHRSQREDNLMKHKNRHYRDEE